MASAVLENPPCERFLLSKEINNAMTDYSGLYDFILNSSDYMDLIEKVGEISLQGVNEFYSQSVIMLVAGMSHEMKSPLQTLVGAIDIINEIINEENIDREMMKQCLKVADEARGSIDSIIKVMALCGKELNESDIVPINFEDLIYSTISSFQYREEYKIAPIDISFISENEEYHENFYTIPSFVYHILTNIISNSCNAIFPNGKNYGYIKIICKNEESEKNKIILDVEDNGVGIKGENFNKIFMPFYSNKHVKNSYGLGLFIARSMAIKMGGDIFVKESKPNKTIIRIVIPDLKDGI